MKRTAIATACIFALVVLAGVLHYTDAPPVAVFVLSGVALGGVAWAIGIATESVGAKFGPAVTGVLQSTLGNLPELFIVIFSLSAGELVVAQFSILGSLFANALLVLGLAIAVGASSAEDGVMTFQKRLPNDTSTLLLLSVFLISILGLSDQVGDKASEHQVAISVVGAICLLIVYGAWLVCVSPRPPHDRGGSRRTTRTTHCPSPGRSSCSRSQGSPPPSSRTGLSIRSTRRSRSSASRRRSRGS